MRAFPIQQSVISSIDLPSLLPPRTLLMLSDVHLDTDISVLFRRMFLDARAKFGQAGGGTMFNIEVLKKKYSDC